MPVDVASRHAGKALLYMPPEETTTTRESGVRSSVGRAKDPRR
jgi:hypothetical protein